jgi:hypothetical protein
MHHACGHDPQASLLETTVDRADHVLGNRVGLDDGKGALNRHFLDFRLVRRGKVNRGPQAT